MRLSSTSPLVGLALTRASSCLAASDTVTRHSPSLENFQRDLNGIMVKNVVKHHVACVSPVRSWRTLCCGTSHNHYNSTGDPDRVNSLMLQYLIPQVGSSSVGFVRVAVRIASRPSSVSSFVHKKL